MDSITIALAKGRLGDKAYELFEKNGLSKSIDIDSRKLIFCEKERKITYIFVKPSDVITYVEKGIADLGIVGKDVLLETENEVYEILDLEFGKCKFAIAGFEKQNIYRKNDVLRIATKYPNYTNRYFKDKDQKIEIIKLNGSVELAPILGLSDVIVDIVETGNTLKANGLVVLEDLKDISAMLISNKISYRFKYALIKNIENLLGGQND